eukprot:SAG22_NODE_3721_length_1559_cov_1.507534_1_plen_258_part_00
MAAGGGGGYALVTATEGGHDGTAPPQHRAALQLRRDQLGLLDALVLVVGSIVGTGVFSTPGVVLAACGSVGFSLAAWAAGGLLACCSSLVYCELGAMIPKAGGDYGYITAAFGPRLAWMWAWGQFTVYKPTSLAVSGQVFGRYLAAALGADGGSDGGGAATTASGESGSAAKLLAAGFIVALTAVNVLPVGQVAKVQTAVTVVAKPLLVLLIVSLAVAFCVAAPATAGRNFAAPFATVRWAGLGPAVMGSLFAYNGW